MTTQTPDASEMARILADTFEPMCAGFGNGNMPRAIAEEFARAGADALSPSRSPVGGDLTIADYEAAFESHRALVRRLDVALNGDGAARQASLCDIVGQVEDCRWTLVLAPVQGDVAGLEPSARIDWTRPVETMENPPRPVRVLGDAPGGAIDYVLISVEANPPDTQPIANFDIAASSSYLWHPPGEYCAGKESGFVRGTLAVRNVGPRILSALAAPPSPSKADVEALVEAARAVTLAAWTDRFGRFHGQATVIDLEDALASFTASHDGGGGGGL